MDAETANLINTVVGGLNDYLMAVAEKQIYLAFEHAQKEREFLSQRTSEGLKQAKLMGSKVGRQKGQHITTKKSKRAKRIIIKHYISFGGELSATECILLCKITKSTFYRYIQEISIEYHIPILRDESNHIILSQKEIVDKIKKGGLKYDSSCF